MLDRMSDNPAGDWNIDDVRTLAKQEGIEVRSPKRGGHFVVASPVLRDPLCIPQNRPIKVIYIKHLVGLVQAHREFTNGEDAR